MKINCLLFWLGMTSQVKKEISVMWKGKFVNWP
jgi:hypothetical protein